MSTLNILTAGVAEIDVDFTSTWNTNGKPMVAVTGETIPKNVLVQQLIYPTDISLNTSQVTNIMNTRYGISNDPATLDSGILYTTFEGAGKLSSVFDMPKSSENTYHKYSYGLRYTGEEANDIYNLVVHEESDNILSKPSHPYTTNFTAIDGGYIKASGVATSSTEAWLYMDIKHGSDLVNQTVGQSKYRVKIVDVSDVMYEYCYSITGDKLPYNSTPDSNDLQTGLINIKLPFSKIDANGDTIETEYNISITYYGQDGRAARSITFNTSDISKFNDDFDVGNDTYNSMRFLRKKSSFLVDTDISEKKRLVLDVENIELESNKCNNSGTYTSQYYNLDLPLYTFMLKTEEGFANNISKDSINYYVQLGEEIPVRISPITRGVEYDNNGSTQTRVPKMLVLDELNLQSITTDVAYFNLPSIYSFRIIIEFDVKHIDGSAISEYFIPPFVDSFECHVTDRQSYLRI